MWSPHNEAGPVVEMLDARRHPRFKLQVDIRVYPRNCEVVRGYTLDISESGIAAMLRDEVPLEEIVRLEFTLPSGDVDIQAMVRQRRAFRYGFQFLASDDAHELIHRTCQEFAMDESLRQPGVL
jgi:c-di-GMP-binding flagellar brake protein YcgR